VELLFTTVLDIAVTRTTFYYLSSLTFKIMPQKSKGQWYSWVQEPWAYDFVYKGRERFVYSLCWKKKRLSLASIFLGPSVCFALQTFNSVLGVCRLIPSYWLVRPRC